MANVGDICLIQPRNGKPIYGEVAGFRDETLLIMPLAELTGNWFWKPGYQFESPFKSWVSKSY